VPINALCHSPPCGFLSENGTSRRAGNTILGLAAPTCKEGHHLLNEFEIVNFGNQVMALFYETQLRYPLTRTVGERGMSKRHDARRLGLERFLVQPVTADCERRNPASGFGTIRPRNELFGFLRETEQPVTQVNHPDRAMLSVNS
jgi:hypothetical protein